MELVNVAHMAYGWCERKRLRTYDDAPKVYVPSSSKYCDERLP
jgi:hypothetical protein